VTYAPASACGRGCLPQLSTVPRVALPIRTLRVLALVAVLTGGIGLALVVPWLSATTRGRAMRSWFRAVVAASGVRLLVHDSRSRPAGQTRTAATPSFGQPHSSDGRRGPDELRDLDELRGPDGEAVLVAANHVSWLDIPALLAVASLRVVAKSEVRGWPVLGLLAARGGTIFIDRRRLRRLPQTVAEIAQAIRDGQSVLVFPEGSTWCGRVQGRTYPATLESAIDAGASVRPVALRYRFADGSPTAVAAFVGDDTMLASVWRVVSARGLVVDVDIRPLVAAPGRRRREIAAAVAAELACGQAPPATAPTVEVPHLV